MKIQRALCGAAVCTVLCMWVGCARHAEVRTREGMPEAYLCKVATAPTGMMLPEAVTVQRIPNFGGHQDGLAWLDEGSLAYFEERDERLGVRAVDLPTGKPSDWVALPSSPSSARKWNAWDTAIVAAAPDELWVVAPWWQDPSDPEADRSAPNGVVIRPWAGEVGELFDEWAAEAVRGLLMLRWGAEGAPLHEVVVQNGLGEAVARTALPDGWTMMQLLLRNSVTHSPGGKLAAAICVEYKASPTWPGLWAIMRAVGLGEKEGGLTDLVVAGEGSCGWYPQTAAYPNNASLGTRPYQLAIATGGDWVAYGLHGWLHLELANESWKLDTYELRLQGVRSPVPIVIDYSATLNHVMPDPAGHLCIADSQFWLHGKAISASEGKRLDVTSSGYSGITPWGLTWSPDSTRLAYVLAGELCIADLSKVTALPYTGVTTGPQ